jgi:hypothetical protein
VETLNFVGSLTISWPQFTIPAVSETSCSQDFLTPDGGQIQNLTVSGKMEVIQNVSLDLLISDAGLTGPAIGSSPERLSERFWFVLPGLFTFGPHTTLFMVTSLPLADFRSVNTVYQFLCVCRVAAPHPVEFAVIELPVH